jgi:glycosyltransferase involved in cell wall biosynthesis
MPEWVVPNGYIPDLTVTVVVPARQEAVQIEACLNSVLNGTFPQKLLEIIVVDDFSEDETVSVVKQWLAEYNGEASLKLLELAGLLPPEHRWKANKKAAIAMAVAQARGALIATIDADCLAPANWLFLMTSRFDADARLQILTAPVAFQHETNLLQRFQSLDFLGLMGITGAGIQMGWHRMGNGANLAYRKTAFSAVGAFAGNDHIASGDDMFLLQKIAAKYPGSVGFLKHPGAVVLTEAKASWLEFWQQRLRWGAKNAAMPEWPIRLVLLAVWLFCVSIWVALLLFACGLLPWQVLVVQWSLKGLADWLFLRGMCRYFGREDLMRWFLPSFLLHTGYIAVSGLASLVWKKYSWKGREIG